MYDIFISHSSKDKKEFVEPLVSHLQTLGLRVWYDKYNIHSGDKVKDSILSGILQSVMFVSIVSNNYYDSNWSSLELGVLQSSAPDNLVSVIFPEAMEKTTEKYPFLLERLYIQFENNLDDVARQLQEAVLEKKEERGLWYIEKTDLKGLIKEMNSYDDFKLNQIAIKLNIIEKRIDCDLLNALNDIRLILEIISIDIATSENIATDSKASPIEVITQLEFINSNLKNHILYLLSQCQKHLWNVGANHILAQEELYLIQFSLFSVVEWYVLTYFKKPVLKRKILEPVLPEKFTSDDVLETWEIEKLVLPQDLIASPDTVLTWLEYNPLTLIGCRDLDTGKIVGFFNTLPITDSLYEQIYTGSFDDTCFSVDDIRQYDIPGFYKLYLCSFCIHPAYNTTLAFKRIYTTFIDFLLSLAEDRDIFISHIIADGVTPKGSNLCESIGMNKITSTIHNSSVYEGILIPPTYTTLKLNNVTGKKLISYYKRKYNEYKELF